MRWPAVSARVHVAGGEDVASLRVDATRGLPYSSNRAVATFWRPLWDFLIASSGPWRSLVPPSEVWAALTTADGLGAWFGHEATIDLHPGGSVRVRWTDGSSVEMRVERVEEPTVFGFTWRIHGLPEDDLRRT
jgi:hypothetical protein